MFLPLPPASTLPSPLGSGPSPFNTTGASANLDRMTIQHLALQLEQWRGVLPPHLGWQEDSPGAFPDAHQDLYTATTDTILQLPPATRTSPISPMVDQPPQTSTAKPTPTLMFTTDLDAPPTRYPYNLDIQVALLRSRYYYTKYLITP